MKRKHCQIYGESIYLWSSTSCRNVWYMPLFLGCTFGQFQRQTGNTRREDGMTFLWTRVGVGGGEDSGTHSTVRAICVLQLPVCEETQGLASFPRLALLFCALESEESSFFNCCEPARLSLSRHITHSIWWFLPQSKCFMSNDIARGRSNCDVR